MIAAERRDGDTVLDIPDSWWRDHLHVAVVKVICDHVEDFQPVADFLSE